MRCPLRILVIPFLLLGAPSATCAESTIAQWHLDPFWQGTTMHGESLFFLEPNADEAATAPLLFLPDEILSVVHPPTGTTFEEGRDFTLDKEQGLLTLTPDSRIPYTTRAEFEPPVGKSGQLYRDETRDIFFGAGPFFHNLQVEITYTHAPDAWTTLGGPIPESATTLLPTVMARLGQEKSLTLCLLGDSISAGLDASSMSDSKPNTPPYGDLVAQGLEARFGTSVNYTNFSVSGKATPWGIEQAAAVAEKKPDLVIIAFGMNDASGRMTPAQFQTNTKGIMEAIRAIHPDTAFILVASMLGNTEWKHAAGELYPQYRDALKELEGANVAIADLTSIWTTFLHRKRFVDITGNGVNHPNDFGHRVYAEVILALFGDGPKN